MFNQAQCAGDYPGTGITAIAIELKNFSSTEKLYCRLAIAGGLFVPRELFATGTSISISLDCGSGWTHVVFLHDPAALTAVSSRSGITGNDVMAILANVIELRLLDSTNPDWSGPSVTATSGIDNIQVIHLPRQHCCLAQVLLWPGLTTKRRYSRRL